VQELLGHADIQTARYMHSNTRTKQSAMERLSGLLGTADHPAEYGGAESVAR